MTTYDRHDESNTKIVNAPMPVARFEALIASYGAAPDRWPEAERGSAEALIERSAEARDALSDAARLDGLLDIAEAPPPSDALSRNLERRFNERRSWSFSLRPPWRIPWLEWIPRPAVALAGVAALVLVGFALARLIPETASTASAPTLARALPPIVVGSNGFVEDEAPLEPEIALIDPSIANFSGEGGFDESLEPGLLLASGPSLEEIPLE